VNTCLIADYRGAPNPRLPGRGRGYPRGFGEWGGMRDDTLVTKAFCANVEPSYNPRQYQPKYEYIPPSGPGLKLKWKYNSTAEHEEHEYTFMPRDINKT